MTKLIRTILANEEVELVNLTSSSTKVEDLVAAADAMCASAHAEVPDASEDVVEREECRHNRRIWLKQRCDALLRGVDLEESGNVLEEFTNDVEELNGMCVDYFSTSTNRIAILAVLKEDVLSDLEEDDLCSDSGAQWSIECARELEGALGES